METDRLLAPSKDVQKTVENLWSMVHRAGDILAAKQDRDAEIQTRIAYLESEIESKNSALSSQAATMENWKEEIATIDELRATMKALYEKLNDMQAELKQRDEHISRLSDAAGEHSEQREQNEVLSTELSTLRAEMQSWQTRAHNLEQTLQERGHQLNEAQEQEQRVREELQREVEHRESQASELSTLRTELEQLQGHVQRQHDASTEYKSQLEEMTGRMYETEKQLILADEKLHYYEALQTNPSDTPTLIEGMLRDEIEKQRLRIAELEILAAHQAVATGSVSSSTPAHTASASHLASSLRDGAELLTKANGSNGSSEPHVDRQAAFASVLGKLRSAIEMIEKAAN